MIAETYNRGLIVARCPQAVCAFDEVVAFCGWPVLLHATPRQLRHEVLRQAPRSLLFWLDIERDLAGTFRLLAWSAAYQPAVRRVAVGYQLSANVEVAVRNAGVHVYLDAADNVRELVNGSIFQSLLGDGRCPVEVAQWSVAPVSSGNASERRGVSRRSGQPP